LRLISSCPSVPQVVHTNFDPLLCDRAKTNLLLQWLACPEGTMLLAWTKESYSIDDHVYYSHFYIYIPYWGIVILLGDMVHAGGFCFGHSPVKECINLQSSFLELQWQ